MCVCCCLFIKICITFYGIITTLSDLEMDRRAYVKLRESRRRSSYDRDCVSRKHRSHIKLCPGHAINWISKVLCVRGSRHVRMCERRRSIEILHTHVLFYLLFIEQYLWRLLRYFFPHERYRKHFLHATCYSYEITPILMEFIYRVKYSIHNLFRHNLYCIYMEMTGIQTNI